MSQPVVKNNPYKRKKAPPRIPYVAKPDDELDVLLGQAINEDLHELVSANSIQRLGNAKVSEISWKIGLISPVYFRNYKGSFEKCKRDVNSKSKFWELIYVIFKIGGGWMLLEEFLKRFVSSQYRVVSSIKDESKSQLHKLTYF